MRKKLMYGVTAIAMAASILTGCSESKKEFPSKEITSPKASALPPA